MDMHGNADRSPKESRGSNDILGKNKQVLGVETSGDTPESKKQKLTNDSREEERPSIPLFSEMEQPTRVETSAELMGRRPSRDVSNQVSRQLFGDSSRVGFSQGQGSGVTRDPDTEWVSVREITRHGLTELTKHEDKKGLNLVRIDGWRPLCGPELGIRMLEETSANFMQPSPSLITQLEQNFLVELDAGGFLFEEITCHHQSSISENFLSCHFSADGRFLACAGHGKKVTVWNKEDSNFAITEKSHSDVITEVRFRPSARSTMYATSSYDRTVKTWDAAYPDIVYATLNADFGHPILSLDFHPRDRDLLCFCDANDLIQLWNIFHNGFMKSFKGGTRQVRFQPRLGKLLAAASGKFINIFETENYKIRNKLKGHSKEVISICWDQTGNYIASVSEDEARFWSTAPEGGLLHVLACQNGKFESCIFHPSYPNLLIIAAHKCLEFWIPQRGYSLNCLDGDGTITGLATSPQNQMAASVSGDSVKLWKI